MGRRSRRIACLFSAPWNPYLRLLYEHLSEYGFEVVEDRQFSLRSLWRDRRSIGFLHFHWPEGRYRYQRGPLTLRPLLSQVKLGLFAARLAAARSARLPARLDDPSGLPSRGRRGPGARSSCGSTSSGVLAGSRPGRACRDDGRPCRHRSSDSARADPVVPHGSYIGVYPPRVPGRRSVATWG